ncbi:MAG TPA: RNA-binding protein [Planctomycetales bacterium]|jgi:hypothetical protein|nr:RNA-binding protein [Planctomycetales bacterium]
MLRTKLAFLFTAFLLALGCSRPSPSGPSEEAVGPAWFEDVTEKLGLDFHHDAGPIDRYFLPQITGSGAALFDYDNDGRLDIYLVQNGGPQGAKNRLFHQKADGRFEDVSVGSGLDVAGYGMGVAIGDVNNDGLPDVFLTEYGRIRLFLNNGDGTFTDVSEEAGLHSNLWGTSASFVDYDRDGWLDLVVVNYVDFDNSRACDSAGGKRDYCAPDAFPGSVTRLYHNLGVQPGAKSRVPRFEDVTLKSGLAQVPGPGLGVICADFDGDGWPDLFVTNDAKPNRLWINQHDGTFKDEAVSRGVAYDGQGRAAANMGTAIADVYGDGLCDLFVTHLTWESNTLWKQGPRGLFQDRTAASGLPEARWRGTGFGVAFGDFDQDGAPDLALVNGRVARREGLAESNKDPFWGFYAERNQLFVNDGSGRFRDVSLQNPSFCGTAAVSRGLAVGDVDGDGALDLLTTTVGGAAHLYRNIAPNRGHWLLVRAVDPALRRDAYGAEITVQAGGRRRVSWINPGQSYLCSNDCRAHFGLGASNAVDSLEVLWPDGVREIFPGRPADQVVVLRKGEGKPIH